MKPDLPGCAFEAVALLCASFLLAVLMLHALSAIH